MVELFWMACKGVAVEACGGVDRVSRLVNVPRHGRQQLFVVGLQQNTSGPGSIQTGQVMHPVWYGWLLGLSLHGIFFDHLRTNFTRDDAFDVLQQTFTEFFLVNVPAHHHRIYFCPEQAVLVQESLALCSGQ